MAEVQRRRFLFAACALLAAPFAHAQRPKRAARLGYLVPYTTKGHESGIGAFRNAMGALGHQEGKTYSIEFRSPEGRIERLPALAAELVALEPDVLVTAGTRAAFALKRATRTIPIVAASVGDAVASGLVADLARPDANITGTTFVIQDLYAKRLELLHEMIPNLDRAAVLLDPSNPVIYTNMRKMNAVAVALGVRLTPFEARKVEELEPALAGMVAQGFAAVAVMESPMLGTNAWRAAELAFKYRVAGSGNLRFGNAGGLIGYGETPGWLIYRAAYFVDRILKGARPADLPFEQPTKFELVVSAKLARVLGVTIPQSILLRADRLIE